MSFPGGVNTQVYWQTTAPSYAALQTIPENRVYVSAGTVAAFMRTFLAFSGGKVVSDNPDPPGLRSGRRRDSYRRICIQSEWQANNSVTDGRLPYPYGREVTGYEARIFKATIWE